MYRFSLLFVSLLPLSSSALAAQAEENSAASADKQGSPQAPAPNASNKNAKGASTGSDFRGPFPGVESGSVSGNLYRNDFLGFSYEFHEDWVAEKPNTLHELSEKWEADAKRSRPLLLGRGVVIPIDPRSPKIIFYASSSGKGDGSRVAIPSIRISAQATDARSLNIEMLRRESKNINQKFSRLLRSPEAFSLKGRSFFRVEFESMKGTPHVWVSRMQTYLAGHIVLFEFFASGEEELQQLTATIQSVSFLQDKP